MRTTGVKKVNFGTALEALKEGYQATRKGWNGKGMFIVLQSGYPDGVPINANTAKALGLPEGTVCTFRPYITMKTSSGEFEPWVASQSDLLEEDWDVL